MNILASSTEELAFVTIVFGLFTTVFWMVVGWRAMKAHERLAAMSEVLVRKNGNGSGNGRY